MTLYSSDYGVAKNFPNFKPKDPNYDTKQSLYMTPNAMHMQAPVACPSVQQHNSFKC